MKISGYRVTMLVDQGWLDAISAFVADIYPNEVCIFENISECEISLPDEEE